MPPATATPQGDGWPVPIRLIWDGPPVVAADGTAYAWVAGEGDVPRLASFDASGRLRPGWPVDLGPAFYSESLRVLADGTVLAIAAEAEQGRDVSVVHRLQPGGREMPGWPVRIRNSSTVHAAAEGPDGSVLLEWMPTDAESSVIGAYDRSGNARTGWPVTLGDGYAGYGSTRVAPDGTVYVLGSPTTDGGRARLWAYSPDGRTLPGWPITLRSGHAWLDLLPGGRLLVATYLPPATPPQGLCGDASATVLSVVDRRGRTVAGWPRTAKGYASFPAVGPDGTMYYTTGDRLVALGPDGRVRPGWPVAIPRVYPQCGGFTVLPSAGGTIDVVAGGGILAFTHDGRPKAGWPFVPAAGFTGLPCVADAPGVPRPAVGTDGTLYVPTWVEAPDATALGRAGITAVDARGRVVPGWPYALATAGGGGTGATGLVFAAGHLYATLVEDCSGMATLVAFDPDGSVAR
jgi:hypothetical protein